MLGAAVIVSCAGFLILLRLKENLIKDLLKEKCVNAGVGFVIDPERVRRMGTKGFFPTWSGRGVMCVTDYEVIFIPLLGSRIVKIERDDIERVSEREETSGEIEIEKNRERFVFRVKDPRRWIEACEKRGGG